MFIPLRPLLATTFVLLLIGCESKDPQSPNKAVNQQAVDDLAPSTRTLDEALAFLKSGVTSDELHSYLQTTPALVREGRFHWVLKDGSLWTDFQMTDKGAVIQAFASERKP